MMPNPLSHISQGYLIVLKKRSVKDKISKECVLIGYLEKSLLVIYLSFTFLKKDYIYIVLERGEGKEKKRERKSDV